MTEELTIEELRQGLWDIDSKDEIEVTHWESDFLESFIGNGTSWDGWWTEKRIHVAREMIDRYLD